MENKQERSPMVYRKRHEQLPDKRPVLDAMGRCRAALIKQGSIIKYGVQDHVEIQKVTKAIDELARHLTGDATFYHAGGSAHTPVSTKWQDSGS